MVSNMKVMRDLSHSHMDSIRTARLADKPDSMRGEDCQVDIHASTCYNLQIHKTFQRMVLKMNH